MNQLKILILLSFVKLYLTLNSNLNDNEFENENIVETCCSFDSNEKVYLSCEQNQKIRLNLIEIFYNSNEYCSSQKNCCKYKTNCSRRVTKYFQLNCQEKSSCFIDKTCFKIDNLCSYKNNFYGQYLNINYSCLTFDSQFDSSQSISLFIKFLQTRHWNENNSSQYQNSTLNKQINNKSSFLLFIFLILSFLLFMFFTSYLAHFIRKRFCQFYSSQRSVKTNTIENNFHFLNSKDNLTKVDSMFDRPQTKSPSPFNSSHRQAFVYLQHNPFKQQTYSSTSYHYFNYYGF